MWRRSSKIDYNFNRPVKKNKNKNKNKNVEQEKKNRTWEKGGRVN